MQDTLRHILPNSPPFPASLSCHKPHFSCPGNLPGVASASASGTISLPQKPAKAPFVPSISRTIPQPRVPAIAHHAFEEKMLYLDSIGIDFFALLDDHPPVAAASLAEMRSTVEYMTTSAGFTAAEFRRIVGMCPELLCRRLDDLVPVFTFLVREAGVPRSDLKRVVNRRPRLLVCSVASQLRPTLYFLQSLGIAEVNKHASLLSCSVRDKLLPRIEYFEKIGFSRGDAVSIFRRFPPLFCYSIKNNLEPKYNYFVMEMGRDLKELKEFPQYFSFSLENRIKPRHQRCVEKGVCFPLPVLLKTNEAQFRDRLQVFSSSSTPLRTSPLWSA